MHACIHALIIYMHDTARARHTQTLFPRRDASLKYEKDSLTPCCQLLRQRLFVLDFSSFLGGDLVRFIRTRCKESQSNRPKVDFSPNRLEQRVVARSLMPRKDSSGYHPQLLPAAQ
eukprot:Tamp_26042.p2 GENE.Tamp_26042~~Tamp_26042.p2  ORF type:complete len:116 (-),score=0.44 Tamp_26042:439-786(-)